MEFIKRHPVLTLFILAILGMYVACNIVPAPPPTMSDVSTPGAVATPPAPRVESRKVENADSLFVTPLLPTLSSLEYKIYGVAFYQAMVAAAGAEKTWQTSSGFGRITAGEIFTGANVSPCRRYAERYTIRGQTQTKTGIACAGTVRDAHGKPVRGWCKLPENATPSCNIQGPSGLEGFFSGTTTSWHNMKTDTGRWWYGVTHWF